MAQVRRNTDVGPAQKALRRYVRDFQTIERGLCFQAGKDALERLAGGVLAIRVKGDHFKTTR